MARTRPGRFCPSHYRYSPAVFARAADFKARSLYIVGGLYGNPFALETVLAMARRESAALVFNGDFNWFNVNPTEFERVNEAVLLHVALRGNVETEIAGEDSGAGCGCAYPEWVGDAEVERSNEILGRLRGTARAFPQLRARLGELPMYLVAEIGGLRVGIVHGDAESLAGWQFSQEALGEHPERAQALLAGAGIDVFACTHTCLPVMQQITGPRGTALVVNNGAAGMPNFRDTRFGLATRIASAPSTQALYGTRLGATTVEAVPVRYDHEAWIARFDRVWPAGSPASLSYRKRIASGPGYEVEQAVRTGVPTDALSRMA
jgi:predicted phosphodiesterase